MGLMTTVDSTSTAVNEVRTHDVRVCAYRGELLVPLRRPGLLGSLEAFLETKRPHRP